MMNRIKEILLKLCDEDQLIDEDEQRMLNIFHSKHIEVIGRMSDQEENGISLTAAPAATPPQAAEVKNST